jgi:hypothetical protein
MQNARWRDGIVCGESGTEDLVPFGAQYRNVVVRKESARIKLFSGAFGLVVMCATVRPHNRRFAAVAMRRPLPIGPHWPKTPTAVSRSAPRRCRQRQGCSGTTAARSDFNSLFWLRGNGAWHPRARMADTRFSLRSGGGDAHDPSARPNPDYAVFRDAEGVGDLLIRIALAPHIPRIEQRSRRFAQRLGR